MQDINKKMEELLNSQEALICKMRIALRESEKTLRESQKQGGIL